MKELSIEQKAKAYDKALGKARRYYDEYKTRDNILYVEDMEDMFPELKESEDERIRKELIRDIDIAMPIETAQRYIAWLEKQSEQKSIDDLTQQEAMDIAVAKCFEQGKSALDAAQEEKVDNQNCVNPADKVEPKFKVGDWIIRSAEGFKHNTYLVTEVKDYYVCEELKGRRVTFTFNDVHNNFKLWTIQDAKDGDVLAYRGEQWIFIYKERKDETLIEYYALASERDLTINDVAFTVLLSCIVPATKEQRDLLFQKMHEAGYMWDAEKKKLKKIEQKPAWSEEDEKMLKGCTELVGSTICASYGEEDGVTIDSCRNWLKSLRPQSHWKPSVEHIEALKEAYNRYSNDTLRALESLYQDLKKLREE